MPLDTSKEYYVKCFNEGVIAYHNETACKYNSKHYKAKAWQDGWNYERSQQVSIIDFILDQFQQIDDGKITAKEAEAQEAAKRRQLRIYSEKAKALFRAIRIDEIMND